MDNQSPRLLHKVTNSFEDQEEELASPLSSSPLLTFGVIADIQYADIPDGTSFSGTPRYYRHALEASRIAATHFQRERTDLLVNLGDMIDGKCRDCKTTDDSNDRIDPTSSINGGHLAIKDVVQALNVYQHGPVIHTYGNHELYSLSREELGEILQIPFSRENDDSTNDLVGYRCHVPCPGVRLVVIDSYDIAKLGRCPTHSSKHKKAEQLLKRNNPNYPELENSPEGIDGLLKRFVAFNGGVGETQIQWLHESLQEAREMQERVIILSHQPIHPDSTHPVCLIWNYDEILDILRQYKDVVVASLSGHAHKGGYTRDEHSGIHFRVIEAVLESPHPHKTYGFVDVHADKMIIRGEGHCVSAVYEFDHLPFLVGTQ